MGQTNRQNEIYEEGTGLVRTVASSIIGGLAGSLLSVILMILCSFFALSRENPDTAVNVVGVIIPAASYFFSGILSYKLSRRAPLICALVCAPIIMFFHKLLSFIFKADAPALATPIRLVLAVVCVALAIMGAILSANLSFRRKGSKSKRKRG